MATRRAEKIVKASGDPEQLSTAETKAQDAKAALGKRGPVWWADGSHALKHQVANTPFAYS
ncbi:hypothetical protein D3C84_929220 [compost metagenome]